MEKAKSIFTRVFNPKGFGLPIFLIGVALVLPIVPVIILRQTTEGIEGFILSVFMWSGRGFIWAFRFLPSSVAYGLQEGIDLGRVDAIIAANLLPVAVFSIVTYTKFTRRFAAKRHALGLALVWGIFLTELMGLAFIFFFGIVSALMGAW